MRVRILIVCLGLVGTLWAQIDTRISPDPIPAEQTPNDTSSKWTGTRLTGFLGEGLGSTLEQGMEASFAVSESEANQLATSSHYGLSRITGTLDFNRDWSRASMLLQYAGGADISANAKTHYQQLFAAEAFKWSRWNFYINQGISYLPQSSYGFYATRGIDTGLPGFVVLTPEGPALLLSVNSGQRTASGQANAEYLLGTRSSVTLNGSFSDLHFTGATTGTPLLDSQMLGSGAQYTYKLSGSTAIGAGYGFLQGRSLGVSSVLRSHSLTATFSRDLGKRLGIRVSGGPQFSALNDVGTEINVGTSVLLTAGVNYQLERTKLGLSYFRGVNQGAGLFLASRSSDVQASVDRQFSSRLRGSISAGFARSNNIGTTTVRAAQHYSATYVAATVEQQFGQMLSGFFVYSVQNQTSDLLCNTSGCPIFNLVQMGTIGVRFHIHPLTLQP